MKGPGGNSAYIHGYKVPWSYTSPTLPTEYLERPPVAYLLHPIKLLNTPQPILHI